LFQPLTKSLAKLNTQGVIEQPLIFISLGMVNNGNSKGVLAGVGLAVPRLENVRVGLHLLRRGTSGGKTRGNSFPYKCGVMNSPQF
jgi:hypothetical protein